MTLQEKMVVLAIANLVGFAAAVTANHFYPFSHAIRTPNLHEYLWFLGGMLLVLALTIPLARRSRSAIAMAGLAGALPAASVWIAANIGHLVSWIRIYGFIGTIDRVFSSAFFLVPFLTYLVTYAYLVSIVSAIIVFSVVKYSNRTKWRGPPRPMP